MPKADEHPSISAGRLGTDDENKPQVFLRKDDSNCQDVSLILKKLIVDNIDNVVVGHLNVNSIPGKLDAIKTIIPRNVDIMIR